MGRKAQTARIRCAREQMLDRLSALAGAGIVPLGLQAALLVKVPALAGIGAVLRLGADDFDQTGKAGKVAGRGLTQIEQHLVVREGFGIGGQHDGRGRQHVRGGVGAAMGNEGLRGKSPQGFIQRAQGGGI